MQRTKIGSSGQLVPAGLKSMTMADLRALLVIARERGRPSLDPDWLDEHASGSVAHLRVLLREPSPPSGYRCEVFVEIEPSWNSFLLDIAEQRYGTLSTKNGLRVRRQARMVARAGDAGSIRMIGYGPNGELRLPASSFRR